MIQLFKSKKRKAQESLDQNIETSLLYKFSDVSLTQIAKHSNKEKISEIVSERICDCLRMAVHPENLSRILMQLGLFTTTRNEWSNKEIELAALIQQYVMRKVDTYNLSLWCVEIGRDMQQGFAKLNNSFLAKVRKNMMVWSPLDTEAHAN